MKKIICAALVVLCALSTAACSPAAQDQSTAPSASVSITPSDATTKTPVVSTIAPTAPILPTTTGAHYESGEPYYTFGDNYTLSFQIDGQTRSYSANYPKETTSESRSERLAVMWTNTGVSVMTAIISKDSASDNLIDIYANIKEQMEVDYKDAYVYFEAPNFRFLTPKVVTEGNVKMCKAQGIVTYYLGGTQKSRTFICYATKLTSGDILYWCTVCTVSDWTSKMQVSENIAKTFREVA